MSLGERIKKRREELGMSQEVLAQKLNYKSRSSINKIELGLNDISQSKIMDFAKALRTSPAYLMGWDENPDPDKKLYSPNVTNDVVTFPVLGKIAAGYDELAVEDWSGDTVEIPVSYLKGRPRTDYFVLCVHGDSMYPLYHDGDKVLILKQTTLNNSGDIGAIMYDDDCATLKKVEFIHGEDWLKLIPINPEYMPKTITGERLEHCRVIGIPKMLVREIN